jgi:hypothetical protein
LGDYLKKSIKEKYISSAFLLLVSTVIVKIISAIYKIPLTAYIGATGRGYFSIAYNLCLPIHALTMGAFPIAMSKLVSKYNAIGDKNRVTALKSAGNKLFFFASFAGIAVMLLAAKPYSELISNSPKSIYTIFALAPSVFFCCLGAGRRSFAEGFIDMKPTALCQIIEAVFKMVFGLLFARYSMSYFMASYYELGTVLNIAYQSEKEALSAIYPLTSACAMLGVSFGGFAGYVYVSLYVKNKYKMPKPKKDLSKEMYHELVMFSFPLLIATAVQSVASFFDTSSLQYALTLCDKSLLSKQYNYFDEDVFTYVFGVYSSALDFKNLVPGIVMALGVTAVPAVSSSYESNSPKFNALINSIMKYTSILACFGGCILALFSSEILTLFYGNSNSDISKYGSDILFYLGVFILPCCLASSCVFCSQSLGLSKKTIAPFLVSGIVRVVLNIILIPKLEMNISSSALSNFGGFLLILIWNMITVSKETGAKFSIKDIFIKPIFCSATVYFAVKVIKESFFNQFSSLLILIICGIICTFLTILLLLLFKCIKLSDIISPK